MTVKRAWIEGEPSLEELMSDPIVDAVLRSDGLTRRDIWKAVQVAKRRLRAERETPSAAA